VDLVGLLMIHDGSEISYIGGENAAKEPRSRQNAGEFER
jgi:hypothetical protein